MTTPMQFHSLPEDPKETLLNFPCTFAVKAMGKANSNFTELVSDIIKPHVPSLQAANINSKGSKEGNFTAVTVTFTAESKAQLDDIYRALSAHPEVLMAL